MSTIYNTLLLLQFFLLILQVFSEQKENRLLGATQLTKEQIIKNYRGSASVALGYNDSLKRFLAGAIITQDKFVVRYYGSAMSSVIASNLVQPVATIPIVADGEVYLTTGPSGRYNGDVNVYETKFGPLKSGTHAIPATLAPAGSPPLPEGTTGCIAYTYGPNTAGDTNPVNFKLGYLPLTVLADSECYLNTPLEQSKYFCGSVSSPDGKAPLCNTVDFPQVAFCPPSTFGLKSVIPPNSREDKEKWCLLWWCGPIEEEEENWILVGVNAYIRDAGRCGQEVQPKLVFYYTANIN